MLPPFETERLTYCAVAGLALILGLAELFLGILSPRLARWWPLAAGVVLALGGAGLALTGVEAHWWIAPSALALFYLGLAACRLNWTEWLFGRAGWLARQPRFQAALVVVAAGVLLAGQLRLLDRELAGTDLDDLIFPDQPTIKLKPLPSASAFTDVGHTIDLFHPEPGTPGLSDDWEKATLEGMKLDRRVIAMAPSSLESNCHGWVFTGGKYWVRGVSVATIVKDNGYEVVSRPVEGDLAVFRGAQGDVLHSALVHSASRDGTILLESKWAQAARYIHTVEGHPYASHSVTYYRSRRAGHLLRGIGPKAEGSASR